MRRFLPSLSALHAFDAAVRYLSFTKAAEDLCVTQSGISRQIRNLEEFLGVTLFERAGPRIILTAAGRAYYEEISHLLDRMEEVSIDAVRGRTTEDFLRIGMSPTLARRWALPVLKHFAHAEPEILFEVVACPNTQDPADFDANLFFLRGVGNWAACRSHLLFEEDLVVVGAPALLPAQGFLAEDDLRRITLIQNVSRPSLWMHWLRAADIPFTGPILGPRFSVTDMIIEAAIAGMGLAVVPESYVLAELADGRLKPAFPQRCSSGEGFYMCCPEAFMSQNGVAAFRRWFLAEARRRNLLPAPRPTARDDPAA
ncbi:LysR substrate-binding domain-containing protein [Tistrella mobilis]|uniref:LysR family transcriptional regulator n=1 Tax=Tistrella mobilis (strain KA081020-065) TaxID=1110502 RepID=I3TTI2_TISMK|nr:LysR substrate-binding domain-containing protein [Tistrella mobilis]AFK56070.1 LysR family transcriptional regulator [Tistrella mobilis KA081020-065]